jgi:ubiquinone/menaquinone biosynthesis C-methylase UbiE
MKPACPTCAAPLTFHSTECHCAAGHIYPVRQEVPVLLVAAEGWDAAATAADFEALYQRESEPWNYTRSGAERLKYRFLVEQATRLAGSSGARVADVGCSLGGAAWELARQGFDVLGLDLSPTAISRARAARGSSPIRGNAEFVVASATRLPLASSSCDLLLLSDGLRSWRLSPEQVRQCLAETSRSLRPGGVAIIQDYMHPRHFDRFIATVADSPLEIVEVRYLNDRLFYKLEGWARKLRVRPLLDGFFASEAVAQFLAGCSSLVGRRGTKHICIFARRPLT